MTVRWLIDKSALRRANNPAVAAALQPRVARGLIGISIATELEIGFSARSMNDHELMRHVLVDQLVPVALPLAAENAARDVQRRLVAQGHHRAVSVPDLLIASTASAAGLTVLHYDADFDLIAEVTGQPTEWVVPRGSV